MNKFIFRPLALLAVLAGALVSCFGATPTGLSSALLTNFNKLYFSLDLSAAPSNIVKGLWLTNNADGSISPSGNADVKVPASVFAGSLLLSNLNTGQAFLIDLGDGTALLVSTNIVTVTNVTYNYSYVTNYYTNVYQQFDYVTNVYTNVYQTFNNVTNYYTNVYQTFNYLTNIFTNVYQEFNYVTNIYKNSTIYYTNTTLIVNGNTNAWWNLRDDGMITPADGRSVAITNTIGAILSAGDTTFVDMLKASQTNLLTGDQTWAHATNGLDLVEFTHVRTLYAAGGNRTQNLPAGWHNASGAAITVTNNTIVKIYVTSMGSTASAALQTNVLSRAEYFP